MSAATRSSGSLSGASSPTTTSASLLPALAAASRSASMRRVRVTHALGSPSTSSWGRKASATAGRRSRCLRVQSARSNPCRDDRSVPSAEMTGDPDPSVAPGAWVGTWAWARGTTGGIKGFVGAGGGAADGPLRFRRVSTDVASARSPTPTDSSGGLSCDRRCSLSAGCSSGLPSSATSPSGGVISSGATRGSAIARPVRPVSRVRCPATLKTDCEGVSLYI